MSSTDALSQTLISITSTKLAELSKQRATFEAKKSSILKSVNDQSTQHEKISILLNGLQQLNNDQVTALKSVEGDDDDDDSDDDSTSDLVKDSLKNIKKFLLQSKFDPSVPTTLLTEWENELRQELETKSLRHRNAYFYGQLVTEWLENPNNVASASVTGNDDDSHSGDSFEEVGRREMHEQRREWESIVFHTFESDGQSIEKYLNDLFMSSKASQMATTDLRKRVKLFGAQLRAKKIHFNTDTLDWCFKHLLKTDLLSDEKRRILREISINKSVVTELADVLNMRIATLDEWSWPSNGVPVQSRRQLNGKYRVYMDEDILDAILLHYLGMVWAVEFKQVFTRFYGSSAWKKYSSFIRKRDRDRREYYLEDSRNEQDTIQSARRDTYHEHYFMSQLPGSTSESAGNYDSDQDSEDHLVVETKSAIEIKHSLLHLVSTESLLATTLHGHFTVLRSDFKWFGPSLPFNSIFTVLKFFGVSEEWIGFFAKFLGAPLKFVQDGPGAQVQMRKRGVPIDHVLSDFMGEALLFCMDYSVNKTTKGSALYRLHDDFWFWGQEETCVAAWDSMTTFAKVMGLEFNEEKTGTVRLSKEGSKPVTQGSLPKGDVRWGFLKLDEATGRFLIDQKQVDEHVTELQRQLAACKSVFAWVQAWNGYLARFFGTNFGKPANCFGRAHVEMMIETFGRIQRKLFTEIGTGPEVKGVTDYLRIIIKERYQVDDLPDGFFYFPIHQGGLELRNPFISLFAIRENIFRNPLKKLQKAFDKDEDAYLGAKEAFEKGSKGGKSYIVDKNILSDNERRTFMAIEEYVRYREETSPYVLAVYKELLNTPAEQDITATAEIIASWSQISPTANTQQTWLALSAYDKWVVQLYAGETLKKFGTLRIVDQEAVPFGVISMLKSGKVKWQG